MKSKNRLANEKSPYLLQHANNPVNWYPWGDEAFKKAKEEDKPIFLSIGYSTCHWCHVMEKESFEDKDVALLMNDAFINIKVDREERPDVDNVYMTVSQLLTGSGGWPLTIIMTPDKKPFLAATYIPKESMPGRTGMLEIVPRIKKLWELEKEKFTDSADRITQALTEPEKEMEGELLTEKTLHKAANGFLKIYDSEYGGFGSRPKFPSPHNLLFLMRYHKRTGKKEILASVEKTLVSMRMGGIFDHVGGGFHRYSTDRQWILPHFEKMLYDQAMLAIAYIEAYQITGKELYKNTAEEIFEFVLNDLQSPEGGFYTAIDADSEGKEGKFYVWTRKSMEEILGKDAKVALKIYNVRNKGNFLNEATGQESNENVLYIGKEFEKLSKEVDLPLDDLYKNIKDINKKLYDEREKRIHPITDDKILTDINGLMIAALSYGARIFENEKYLAAAKKAADFIIEKLSGNKGKLFHRYRNGNSGIEGYIDDYAFFAYSLLELYEATFDEKYLKQAIKFTDSALESFWDNSSGGFYFTSDNSEKLLMRKKNYYDGAIPSGNSIFTINLAKLSKVTANKEYLNKALRLQKSFGRDIENNPYSFSMLLCAGDFILGPSYEIVVVGNLEEKDSKEMMKAVNRIYLPNKVFIFKSKDSEITKIANYLKSYESIGGKATVYICRDFKCKLPLTEVDKMIEILNSQK